MMFPDCSDRRRCGLRAGAIRHARRAPRASSRRSRAARARRCALVRAGLPPRRGPSIRSPCATSRSKACSAPRPAPSSPICRSRSASASTTRRSREAVKALYATGFFRDVRIEAQGDVLVVIVQERPTIRSLTFVGNKEFDTDTIKKALKDVGIAEARIFDRSALERAEQELKRQYITRGKYAATRADHGHAAGAQPRRDQLHDRRRRHRQHRAHQHRRQQGVHREAAALARCS